jgi:type II secretory pathway pseudopilin PulG
VLGIILGVGVAFLMLCVGVGGVMYALLIPAVGKAKMVSQRTASLNNLKQITRALQSYEAEHGSYPPAYVTDAAGKPLYSWRVLLLPYLEEDSLYERFDKTKAWDDPANIDVSNSMVNVFRSPLDEEVADNGTSYVGVVGRNTMFPTGSGRKKGEIVDGMSNTIMVLEVKGFEGSWAEPNDPTLVQFGNGAILGENAGQLLPAQASGATLVGFADGIVRQLDASAAARVVQPVAITVNDGQPNAVE